MLRHPIFSTLVVTVCMLLYQVFSLLGFAKIFTSIILISSPLLMLWMVLSILKENKPTIRELKDDEEWGYSDTDKDSLGMF